MWYDVGVHDPYDPSTPWLGFSLFPDFWYRHQHANWVEPPVPSPPPPMPPPPTPPAGDASAGDECAELVVPPNYAGWTYVRASPERGVDVAGATIAEHRLTADLHVCPVPGALQEQRLLARHAAAARARRLSEPADVGTAMTGDYWGHGHRLPSDYRCNGVVRHLDECYMKAGNTVLQNEKTAGYCALVRNNAEVVASPPMVPPLFLSNPDPETTPL